MAATKPEMLDLFIARTRVQAGYSHPECANVLTRRDASLGKYLAASTQAFVVGLSMLSGTERIHQSPLPQSRSFHPALRFMLG